MPQDQTDPVEALIDRIAEAVVRKIDERDKSDALAQLVLARMAEQDRQSKSRRPKRKPTPRRKANAKSKPSSKSKPASKAARASEA